MSTQATAPAPDRAADEIQPDDTVTCPFWAPGQTAVVGRIETHVNRCGEERVAFFKDGGFFRVSMLRKVK